MPRQTANDGVPGAIAVSDKLALTWALAVQEAVGRIFQAGDAQPLAEPQSSNLTDEMTDHACGVCWRQRRLGERVEREQHGVGVAGVCADDGLVAGTVGDGHVSIGCVGKAEHCERRAEHGQRRGQGGYLHSCRGARGERTQVVELGGHDVDWGNHSQYGRLVDD